MAVKFFVATLICVLLVETGYVRAGPLSTEVFTEVAATRGKRQAGACGCDAYAYDGPNYSGRELLIRQQNARFSNDFFNDRVESLKINGKCTYLFYEHTDFLGNVFIKTPGYYVSLANFGNSISSARALPPQGTNAILLFEHTNYAGRMVALYSSQQNLPFLDYNDHISSVIVTGGSWTLYDHTNYHGSYQTIGVGYYPQPPVGNDRISSIKNN